MSLNEWNYSEGNKLFYSAICFTLTNIKSTFNLFKFTQNQKATDIQNCEQSIFWKIICSEPSQECNAYFGTK